MGFVFQDRHTGLVIRGLDIGKQAPFKTGTQPVFQCGHIAGLPVGGHDDLLMLLVELVEGMEELLLGRLLTGDELDIIDEEQIGFPIFIAEFDVPATLDGGDQLIGELVTLDVDNIGIGIDLSDAVGYGVQQVGFANAGRAIQEQGVIDLARGLTDRNGGAVGEPVGGAYHEIVEIELGIEVHGGAGLALGLVGVQLLVTENDELGIGMEDLLQCVLNIICVTFYDDLPAVVRRRIQDQLFLIQFHHLRVVEPGRDCDGAKALLNMAENLGPNIGG